MSMTDPIEQLRRLVEARAKATAGPWHKDATYTGSVFPDPVVSSNWIMGDGREPDADFIALAGSIDLPAILAAWEADRAIVDGLKTALNGIAEYAKAMIELHCNSDGVGNVAMDIIGLCEAALAAKEQS